MSPRLQITFFYFLPLFLGASLYYQSEMELKTERAFIVNFPNQSLAKGYVKCFKYNRTYTALNLSADFFVDFGNELMVTIQEYSLRGNEYRLGVIYMHLNACEAMKKNSFGFMNFYKCGNLTECPLKKGRYTVCNWGPSSTEFPPFLPEGHFRLDMTLSYRNQAAYRFEWYIKLESNKFKRFG